MGLSEPDMVHRIVSYDRGAAAISTFPTNVRQRGRKGNAAEATYLLSDGADAGPTENIRRTVTETWRAVMTVYTGIFLCPVMIAS